MGNKRHDGSVVLQTKMERIDGNYTNITEKIALWDDNAFSKSIT